MGRFPWDLCPKFLVKGKVMLDRPSPGLVVVDGVPVGLIATISLSGDEHAIPVSEADTGVCNRSCANLHLEAPSMAISIQRFKASTEATQCGNVAG